MKILRITLGILATIPIGLLVYKIAFYPTAYDEHLLRTLIYHAIGVPILILNVWVWLFPEIIESYFLQKKEQDS
jgi:hypothetical protein